MPILLTKHKGLCMISMRYLAMLNAEPFAWVVPSCPDFYFLPSLLYNKIFKEWDNGGWDCPAYWASKKLPVIPCYSTDEEELAQCWISQDKYDRWDKNGSGVYMKYESSLSLWTEALNASRYVQKSVQLLTLDLSSPMGRGAITGPPPTWKSR